ncbi:NAD-dependent epimerase/dehydratase family protein [Pelagibius litoralis]|uniref:NAD-dependent epimerase/dehydratase family protein n=1 Tax=Pelagibius litoralis TaxID=374515 RepID=UPI002AC32E57|nr:NAD-dependent epimerase/dehydratase family protein [Pelagibius litoralis]
MTETTVVITGGAGYIGSHTVLACRENGNRVVVLDNLVKGRRDLLPDDVPFYLGDVGGNPPHQGCLRSRDRQAQRAPDLRRRL